MDFQGNDAENFSLIGIGASGGVLPAESIWIPNQGIPNTLSPDVRQFSSYYLYVAAVNAAAATQYNEVGIQTQWFTDSIATPPIIYQDTFGFWATSVTPGWINMGLGMMIQDAIHGPYMNVRLVNHGNINVGITAYLYASTRTIPSMYARQQEMDGLAVNAYNYPIGAGATVVVPLLHASGRCRVRMQNNGGAAMSFAFFTGIPAVLFEYEAIGAGVSVNREYIFPKRAVRCDIFNSGAATTYTLIAETDYMKL
jgi:hypothetical protein